jgi:hypothetical protein
MTPRYGAGTITRERRTKAVITLLDRQVLDLFKAEQQLSCWHVFYRMTDPRLPEPVEKSEGGYRHVLHRLKQLRRDGVVPYRWITRCEVFTSDDKPLGKFNGPKEAAAAITARYSVTQTGDGPHG